MAFFKMMFVATVFVASTLLTGHGTLAGEFGEDDMFDDFLDAGTGIDIYANDRIKDPGTPEKTNSSVILEDKDLNAKQVLAAIYEKYRWTSDMVLGATTRSKLLGRGKFPYLGPWMRRVIHDDFQEKNPIVVYKLLVRVWHLLQLSRVGCEGYQCGAPVLKITNKYMDIIKNAERASDDSVSQTISILKFVTVAIENINHPKVVQYFMNVAAMKANKLAKDFGAMANDVDELKKLTEDTMFHAKGISQEIIKKFQMLKEENDNVTIQLESQKARRDQLADKIDAEKGRIKKIEADRGELTKKYLEAAKTEVKDTEECDSQIVAQFKLVQNEVKKYITLDKYQKRAIQRTLRCNGADSGCCESDTPCEFGEGDCDWDSDCTGGNTCGNDNCAWDDGDDCCEGGLKPRTKWVNEKTGQEVLEKTTVVKEYARIGDKVDRKCWTKKDKVHLEQLQSMMKSIKDQLKDTRPAYMELLKEIAKSRTEKVDVVGLVAEGMAKVKIFEEKRDEKDKAVDSIDLVVRSLFLMKTILTETKQFWEDTAKYIKKYLIPGMKAEDVIKGQIKHSEHMDDDAIIDAILNKGKLKLPDSQKATIERQGMYWLLFGTMNARAYQILKKYSRKITEGAVMKLTEEMKVKILKGAETTIKEIRELHDTLQKKDLLEQKVMDEALEEAKKEFAALEATDNKDKEPASIDSLLENLEKEGDGDSLLITRDEVELEMKDAAFVAENNEFMELDDEPADNLDEELSDEKLSQLEENLTDEQIIDAILNWDLFKA